MGSAQSTAVIKRENNMNVINQTDINLVNQNINNFTSSVAVSQAKSCSNSGINWQSISLKNVQAGEDLVIMDVNMLQNQTVNFSCVNKSTVRNDIGNKLVQNMVQSLETTVSPDILTQLDTVAKNKADSQALAFGSSNSTSQIEELNNYTVSNTTHKNIENVVKNSVEANFTSKDVQNCINQVTNHQDITVDGAVAGRDIKLQRIKMEQASNIFAQCINESEVGNNMINDIAKNLDIKIKDDVSPTIKVESKIEQENQAVATGLLQGAGTALSQVLNSASGVISMIPPFSLLNGFGGMGTMMPVSASSCLSCCCCIILLAVIFFVMNGMGGSSEEGDGMDNGDMQYGPQGNY